MYTPMTLTTGDEVFAGLGQVKAVFDAINAPKIISCVVLVVICLVAYKLLMRLLDRFLAGGTVEKTLHGFIRNGVRILLMFVAILIVASELGFDVTSLIALLSVAGLAVSLAVQNSLANLAGGIQVLVSKPFKTGDFVDIGGASGTVQEINLIHTKLITPDNKVLYVPNSDVAAARLTNFSTEATRRVDLVFTASYDTAPEAVISALQEMVNAHEKVLKDPEAFVRLSAYKDSAIEYTVRAWCDSADYWDVYFDLLSETKQRFDKAGVEMTYPHMNVHIQQK